jgi:hypothetical protein
MINSSPSPPCTQDLLSAATVRLGLQGRMSYLPLFVQVAPQAAGHTLGIDNTRSCGLQAACCTLQSVT